MAFHEIKPEELSLNPFTRIGQEWMLITAGDETKHNTMTAAWGGLGVIWNMDVATAYVRPQRYTKQFLDQNDRFTLSFFSEQYRDALTILGRNSGRDCDKETMAGLKPLYVDGTTAFEEAEMILVCRKQYHQELRKHCFDVQETEQKVYPTEDYHTMYIGQIEKILVKD